MVDLHCCRSETHRKPAGSYPVPVRRSWNSTCSKGRKALQQKGQLVFRLESSAVQPAIISSSYTRASHERHWEQLDISTWQEKTGIPPVRGHFRAGTESSAAAGVSPPERSSGKCSRRRREARSPARSPDPCPPVLESDLKTKTQVRSSRSAVQNVGTVRITETVLALDCSLAQIKVLVIWDRTRHWWDGF